MKKLKISLALVAIFLCIFIARGLAGDKSANNVDDSLVDTTVYYIPVTNYFSSQTKLTTKELQSKTIYTTPEDELGIREILGAESQIEAVPVDALMVKVSDGAVAIVRWDRVTPSLKTLSWEGKYLFDKDEVGEYTLKLNKKLILEESQKITFDPSKLTKINFLGDIMLSRHVNTQMKRYGYDYPWEKVTNQIADADITFANLEVPISNLVSPPAEGMSFLASTKNITYLKRAGIDVVSVANNHSANFGYKVFEDNLKNLKGAGIGVCGGGQSESEARAPYVIEKNNTRFGFLCQSAITGTLYAEGSNSGVPYLGIEPWYRDSQSSLNDLVGDISSATKISDVVIDSPHWGVEYKNYPNSSQEKVAKLMIDNGVDLVMGTHPHVVQSAEYYRDHLVAYSLGNFIFDQEWSAETKQGVMASAYYYGDRNMAVNLIPLQIENYSQPRFVSGSLAKKIMDDIQEHSAGL